MFLTTAKLKVPFKFLTWTKQDIQQIVIKQLFKNRHHITVLGFVSANGRSNCPTLILRGKRMSMPHVNRVPKMVTDIIRTNCAVLYRKDQASVDSRILITWDKTF